jgi:hypothetical protein
VSEDEEKTPTPKPADPGKLTTQPVVHVPGTKHQSSDIGSRIRSSKDKKGE